VKSPALRPRLFQARRVPELSRAEPGFEAKSVGRVFAHDRVEESEMHQGTPAVAIVATGVVGIGRI
jgi:hypothetical protein